MKPEQTIAILGSTGSIGTQTLEIAREYKAIKISALTANTNTKLLEAQCREFRPRIACMTDEAAAKDLKVRLADTDIKVYSGQEGLTEAATEKNAEKIVTAVVGISGLVPTIEAIKAKKDIALANKETLVAGGHIVMSLAKKNGVSVIPVDSEHSAIFQSLQGNSGCRIKNILLTASGGIFYGKKKDELKNVKPAEAVKNPNWVMGAKVTLDSATLVNKGLEMIEAGWLFDVGIDRIKVMVHRQSILHSAVQFEDNSIIAQLGKPDMRLPIQYALTYPQRYPMRGNEISLTDIAALTFAEPDRDTFSALTLAEKAANSGGIMPCVFNSADEAAVELFLKEKISFPDITQLIGNALEETANIQDPSLEEVLNTDKMIKDSIRSKARF